MADKGIIFSAPMVKALLAGRKTQTRRLLKPQPADNVTSAGNYSNTRVGVTNQWSWLSGDPRDCDTWGFEGDFKVPYAPGDRLYVREHWKTSAALDDIAPRDLARSQSILTLADNSVATRAFSPPWGKHRQGMHMPRWASRLWLQVTDVRVQRLQDISETDAIAEGISLQHAGSSPVIAFETLWNLLHTAEGERWEDNPWIVAVSFDVNHGNIDRSGK